MVDPNNVKTGAQNNKFYTMTEQSNGTFLAEWGRIGNASKTKEYSMEKWDSTIRAKQRKGYTDQTELFLVKNDNSVAFKEISEVSIKKIVNSLMNYASASIYKNYTVSSESVTEKLVNKAQELVDELSQNIFINQYTKYINNILVEIFKVIPRKMGNVNSFILQFPKLKENTEVDIAKEFLKREQDLLDIMRGQVKIDSIINNNKEEDKTILEIMGIDLYIPTEIETFFIKKLLRNCKIHYSSSFGVINKKTQKHFDENLKNYSNQKKRLFWHGSRNENWWSILEKGLVIRPSNAVYTGSMWGDGCYFAKEPKKSLGYTSLYGSYWATGRSDKAFMSLYDVHLGKQLEIDEYRNWCSKINKQMLKEKGDYNSVWAKNGNSLYNDEFVVYNKDQCTIKFIVELKK